MTVRCMRSWRIPLGDGQSHVDIPILLMQNGCPQVPVQEAMGLVLESRNAGEYVSRYNGQWKSKVEQVHSLLFPEAEIPSGFSSFKDPNAQQGSTLTNKSTMPLSCLFALLATFVGRARPDWQAPSVKAFQGIVKQIAESGRGVTVQWRRIGDNTPFTFVLTADDVDPSVLWTQAALALRLLPQCREALNVSGKTWFEDFSFNKPSFSGLLLFCLDPHVLKKQALLQLRGFSAWGFLASHFMEHVEEYTCDLEMRKQLFLQKASFEDSLFTYFSLQKKVRKRQDAAETQEFKGWKGLGKVIGIH